MTKYKSAEQLNEESQAHRAIPISVIDLPI